MSLLLEFYLLERYGPRLTVENLADLLHLAPGTIRNQISNGKLGLPTCNESGGRFADYRDVAAYIDKCREDAKRQVRVSERRRDWASVGRADSPGLTTSTPGGRPLSRSSPNADKTGHLAGQLSAPESPARAAAKPMRKSTGGDKDTVNVAIAWRAIYKYWKTFDVPRVEVIQFNPRKHRLAHTEWVSRSDERALPLSTNGMKATAMELAEGIEVQSDERYAAFALMAYRWEFREEQTAPFLLNVEAAVAQALIRLRPEGARPPWERGAELVLPYPVGNTVERSHGCDSWKDLVANAAEEWAAIAATLAIVRVPSVAGAEQGKH